MILTATQVAALALWAGLDAPNAATAVAVAQRESGFNTTATNHNTNGTVDHGLWQINDVNVPGLISAGVLKAATQLTDPADNARAMAWIHGRSGWSPWSTYGPGIDTTAGRAAVAAAQRAGVDKIVHTIPSARLTKTPSTASNIVGNLTNPVGFVSDVLSSTPDVLAGALGLTGLAGQYLTIALETVFVAAGLALVLIGVWRLTGQTGAQVAQAAGNAATLAAIA